MWTVFEWVHRTLSGFLALVGDPFPLGRYYIYIRFIFLTNYVRLCPPMGCINPPVVQPQIFPGAICCPLLIFNWPGR